jgi:hypothetical protein
MTLARESVTQMASARESRFFRGEFGLCRDGCLVLDSGGYARLSVGEMHNTLQERNHVRH